MFCQKCGHHLSDDALFCHQCGCRVSLPSQSAPDDATLKRRWATGWGRSLILVVLILACAVGVVRLVSLAAREARRLPPHSEFTFTPAQFTAAPTPQPTPYWKAASVKIRREAIALAPGQYWSQRIEVRDEWRNARLVGRFEAQGGSGNDVSAFVTDDDGLINFKNKHRYDVWYQSGRVTVDTINTPLPVGRSYFVVSNTFSVFAHKSVTFDLSVEYERLVQP